jgi:hypothetical protein
MARYIPELDLWRCPRCEKNLPGTCFSVYRRKTGQLRIASECKTCAGQRTAAYNALNPRRALRKDPSYTKPRALRYWSGLDD